MGPPIAILLPVLGRARRQANTVVCLSNLRQLAIARQLYASQNHGKTYVGSVNIEANWYLRLPEHFPEVQRAMYCPEAAEGTGVPQFPYGSPYVGTAFHAWAQISVPGSSQPFRGGSSYGINGWFWVLRGNQVPFTGGDPNAFIKGPVKEPHAVPVFADCAIEFAWPQFTDTPPDNLFVPIPTNENLGMDNLGMRPFCMARHGRAINLVFLDGHAATTALQDLWKLKWHNQWVPTDVTLPAR